MSHHIPKPPWGNAPPGGCLSGCQVGVWGLQSTRGWVQALSRGGLALGPGRKTSR